MVVVCTAAPSLAPATSFQEVAVQAPRLDRAPAPTAQPGVTYTQTYSPGPSQGAAANGYSLGTPMLMNNNVGYGWGFNGGYFDGGYYPGYYNGGGYFNGGYCAPGGGYFRGGSNNVFIVPRADPLPGTHPNAIFNPSPGGFRGGFQRGGGGGRHCR